MVHNFEVGKRYCDIRGEYYVKEIQQDRGKVVVCYDDGVTLTGDIHTYWDHRQATELGQVPGPQSVQIRSNAETGSMKAALENASAPSAEDECDELARMATQKQRSAHVYTDLPKHYGEHNLAKRLMAFPDPRLHLWFNLDYIPDVRENDILLWHEEAGVFVVEVKAVRIEDIEWFSLEKCRIKGRGTEETPHSQARDAGFGLVQYMRPQLSDNRVPFFVGTACWPLISRRVWNQTWDREQVIGDFAERMIFEEDLIGGPSALVSRLKHIWQKAPAGMGSRWAFQHNAVQHRAVLELLSIPAQKKPSPSDLERLQAIEEKVSRETLTEAPPFGRSRIYYYGYPGTGKTFRLLQIGVEHAVAGCHVLFLCFNKVLAAEIRRILSYSKRLAKASGSLKVRDVFELVRKHDNAVLYRERDPDLLGQLVLDDMRLRACDLPEFDTVLVDEAQDMREWALNMAALLAKQDATICIAGGQGQELYGRTSTWYEEFKATAVKRRLNRNFRNTKPVAILAQVFYEAAFESEEIQKVLERFSHRSTRLVEQPLLFERPQGLVPGVWYIQGPARAASADGTISKDAFNVFVGEYYHTIRQQLDCLAYDDRPLDLLVLVPRYNSIERRCAREALERLGVRYIDYTEDDNRRDTAQPDMIRLCTFHSARGIEGRKVVVFGIERLIEVAN